MENDMRDRLIELIKQSHCVDVWDYLNDDFMQPNPIETLADYLIKNGVVPVVRCKDCKYYETHKPSVTLNCERDGRLIPMMPDDYCSYGERKCDNG